VTTAAVEAVVTAAREHGAALLALPIHDTVKRSTDGKRVETTLERSQLFKAQTPQAFAAERFRDALQRAEAEGFRPTDDSALWERYVGPVTIVPGEATNLKITVMADLEIARAILHAREHHARVIASASASTSIVSSTGRPCVLGGIELPHGRGPLGHSERRCRAARARRRAARRGRARRSRDAVPDSDARWKDASSANCSPRCCGASRERTGARMNVDVVHRDGGFRASPLIERRCAHRSRSCSGSTSTP
jgi:hypothetical protein